MPRRQHHDRQSSNLFLPALLMATAFPVEILPSDTVRKLKDLIKDRKPIDFEHSDEPHSADCVVYRVVNNDGKAYALKTFKNDGSGRNFQYEINMLDAAEKHDHLIKHFGVVNDPSGKSPLFELYRLLSRASQPDLTELSSSPIDHI
ncbi:hypothetical protein EC957_007348 [Mortierella hygrophila]|uniref:Crinkler effector protein N-terminal domain-containing protein n=1 Tax=Mortierella hygrophila TaxID=979708 RepID=A0A9P6FD75_9FUNG|nr:hypothetical protein EC957_007348 [Mortierella hygrophila]